MINVEDLNNSIDDVVFKHLDNFAKNRVYISSSADERQKTDSCVYEFMHDVEEYNIKLIRMISFYQTAISHYQDEKKKL